MDIPTGDPLVSAHNELAELYAQYLKERKFDEERVREIMEGSVTRYPVAAGLVAAKPDQIGTLFSNAVSAISQLQGIEIDPEAQAMLAKVAEDKMDLMCAQWNLSQQRRKEGRKTAYKSALQHVLYLHRVRNPMELQTFYYDQVIDKLKGKMKLWQAVLDGNGPAFEEEKGAKKKQQRKPRAKKAEKGAAEEANGQEGDKENESESVEEEAATVKKTPGGRGKRKAPEDASEEDGTPVPKRRGRGRAAVKVEVKEMASGDATDDIGILEETLKTPASKRGRGKAVAKTEPLDSTPKTEVKEEELSPGDAIDGVEILEDSVKASMQGRGKAVARTKPLKTEVKDEEGTPGNVAEDDGKEAKSVKTPASRRGRGRGKAKIEPLDATPKTEVKEEEDDSVDATDEKVKAEASVLTTVPKRRGKAAAKTEPIEAKKEEPENGKSAAVVDTLTRVPTRRNRATDDVPFLEDSMKASKQGRMGKALAKLKHRKTEVKDEAAGDVTDEKVKAEDSVRTPSKTEPIGLKKEESKE